MKGVLGSACILIHLSYFWCYICVCRKWIWALRLMLFSRIGSDHPIGNWVSLGIPSFCMVWRCEVQAQDIIDNMAAQSTSVAPKREQEIIVSILFVLFFLLCSNRKCLIYLLSKISNWCCEDHYSLITGDLDFGSVELIFLGKKTSRSMLIAVGQSEA